MQNTPVYGWPYPESGDSPAGMSQIQALALSQEATLHDGTKGLIVASVTAGGDLLAGSKNGVNALAVTSGTDTTISTAYVNLAGTGSVTSFSFTKRYAGTRIRLQLSASCYPTGAVGGATFGVRINSVDYDVVRIQGSNLSIRASLTGVAYITGVGVGAWTVQGRWKSSSGSVTMTRDVFDWLSIDAQECA